MATVVVAVAVLVMAGVVAIATSLTDDRSEDARRQSRLAPFYRLPDPLPPDPPGSLVRAEPVAFAPPGARGWRVLFRSQGPQGEPTVSSGMVFSPNGSPPAGGRPIVAWAHPTVGMGDDCAPSRTAKPLGDMTWLPEMLARGWVVTAPDYAGLGTAGTTRYLVGDAESNDVLNAVRVARAMPDVGAGRRFAVYGHSQGGHATLFSAASASSYAPDLDVVAAAAVAPAAELVALLHLQFEKAVAWAIGPEVAVSWPPTYPGLLPQRVLTSVGERSYKSIARACVLQAALEGEGRQEVLRQRLFATDPIEDPAWRSALVTNTVPQPAPGVPLLLAQGLSDEIVLPPTSALLVQRYCAAGAALTTDWMPGIGHIGAGKAAAPRAIDWLAARFASDPAPSSCGQPLPVEPAVVPAA